MSWAQPGSHTSAGESGAGFGRLGQAVSGKCEGWSRGAGLRTVIESLYGVAMRRRLKTIEAGWLWRDKKAGGGVSVEKERLVHVDLAGYWQVWATRTR